MRKFIFISLLSALILPPGIAGSANAITMQEAVGIALENNHQLKRYRHLEDSAVEAVGAAWADFYPSLDLGYTFSERDERVFAVGSRFSVFSVEASYNLFNGLADFKGLLEARSSAAAARYKKDSVRADVLLAIKTAFIDVLRARRSVEVAKESVELLERQRRDAELYYREGLIARNDLLRVEVELSSARQDLLEAGGDHRVKRKGLERVMGVGLEDEQKAEDLTGLPDMEAFTSEALREEMLMNRSEIKYLEAVRDSGKYRMEAERGGYLPSIDLIFSYEEYGDSAFPDGIATSYDYDSKVTVTAAWNVFEGLGTRHGVREAWYVFRAAEEELEDTKEELQLQLSEGVEGYRVAKGKLDVAETAVRQAEENYRVTENRFRLREATTVDLLDARFFLTRARNDHNSALYDLHESAATIERVLERDAMPVDGLVPQEGAHEE
jgi:outer membrane protein TolC